MRWLLLFFLFIPITVTGQDATCTANEISGQTDCKTPMRPWHVTEGEADQLYGFWAALSGHEGYNMVFVATGRKLQWKTGDSAYFLYDGSRLEAKFEIIKSTPTQKRVVIIDGFDWLAAASDVRFKIGNTEVFMPDKAIADLKALKKLLD